MSTSSTIQPKMFHGPFKRCFFFLVYRCSTCKLAGGYDVRFLQKTKVSPLELARKQFPRPKPHELNEALSSSLSFLIVREPFERLLSGFRNKLEGHRNKFYKIVGEQIINGFRKGNKRVSIGYIFVWEFMCLLLLLLNARRKDRQ